MIVGPQEQIWTLPLLEGESLDSFRQKVADMLDQADQGEGVLVLLDLAGGTPCNAALLTLREARHKIECIAGANLPMMLDVLMNRRDEPLEAVAARARQSGMDGVVDVCALFAASRQAGTS
jgi:PTS system mannose-specific IIA component